MIPSFSPLLLLLLTCNVMSSETSNSSAAACRNAKWPSSSTILYPSSDGFASATQRWSGYHGPNYCAAVSPASEEEVAAIVKAANDANVPFLATGGRHNFGTTMSKLHNGLAIDLSKLNSITVDADSSTVTVGGGAKNQEVLDAVVAAGFMIPSGTCGCAGYIGAGIGAGIGYLQGTLGLAIDSLVSAKVVGASGDLLDVSKDSNPDLFWAVRGAGTNFGIITSAVFKITKQVNGGQVYYADLIYGPDQKADYFKVVEDLNENYPAKLGFSTTFFWNDSANTTSILATLVYVGTEAEARAALNPFFSVSPVIAVSKMIARNELPKIALMGVIEASCSTVNGVVSIPSLNIRTYSAKTFISVYDKFNAYVTKYPDTRASAFIFETFSSAAALSVPSDSTAYPWRDSTGNIMLQLRWTGLDNPFQVTANAFGREIRAELAATSGYPDMSVYVSYAYGDETLQQKFGDNLPRLQQLKKQWDPKNKFGYCNPLSS